MFQRVKHICSKCSMGLLAIEDEKGIPRWYCSTCDIKTRRTTFSEEFREWWYGNKGTIIGLAIIGSIGFGVYHCFGFIYNSINHFVEQSAANSRARELAYKKKREEGRAVKTWMVFYGTPEHEYQDTEGFQDRLIRRAQEQGVPCLGFMEDHKHQFIKVTTSRNAIEDAAEDLSHFTLGVVREANSND